MNGAGFLGTGATMMSDIVLLCYLFLMLPGMLLGFYFARRKKFVPHHKLTMTGVVILNWIFIVVLMFGSYRGGVLPYLNAQFAGDVRVALPTLHAITGGIAQLLATYLVIRMWFEKVLPKWVMVKRIKRYMRFTLAMWIITVLLGVLIYVTWYVGAPRPGTQIQPAVTAEPGATVEPGATIEPGATPELEGTGSLSPAATPELVVLGTPEIDDDDAARASARATEDAIDDAEDAAKDAARATEDAIDEAEDAAEDAAKATEKAEKDRDDD